MARIIETKKFSHEAILGKKKVPLAALAKASEVNLFLQENANAQNGER